MITFKISNYGLFQSQWTWHYDVDSGVGEYRHHAIVPGKKVCSINRLETVGVITSVDSMNVEVIHPHHNEPQQQNRTYVHNVTVLWLTGPRKGVTEIKQTRVLADFEAYKASVVRHLEAVEKIEAEAAKTGM